MISENWLGDETSKAHYDKCIDNQPYGGNLIVKPSCISEGGGGSITIIASFLNFFLGNGEFHYIANLPR